MDIFLLLLAFAYVIFAVLAFVPPMLLARSNGKSKSFKICASLLACILLCFLVVFAGLAKLLHAVEAEWILCVAGVIWNVGNFTLLFYVYFRKSTDFVPNLKEYEKAKLACDMFQDFLANGAKLSREEFEQSLAKCQKAFEEAETKL